MSISLDSLVVRLAKGETIPADVLARLDPLDFGSVCYYTIPVERPTELHYHDYDEHWLFTAGRTVVTLRLEDGTSQRYEVGEGDLIVTPKGVEHAHDPVTEVKGIQIAGVKAPSARSGHLYREG